MTGPLIQSSGRFQVACQQVAIAGRFNRKVFKVKVGPQRVQPLVLNKIGKMHQSCIQVILNSVKAKPFRERLENWKRPKASLCSLVFFILNSSTLFFPLITKILARLVLPLLNVKSTRSLLLPCLAFGSLQEKKNVMKITLFHIF